MKNSKKYWILLGLALCLKASNLFAAEGVVYQFDGWKVTIKAGRSNTKPPRELPAEPSTAARSAEPDKAVVTLRQTTVRPISFQEPQPTASNPGVDPASSNVVPAPTPEGASIPPSPVPQSNCCDLPVITPMSPDKAPLPNTTPIPLQTALYRDIYFSIPFNRAEYNAYPSYRHDATMELLFNQMRNTVIQRGTTNVYQYDMGGYGSIYTPYYPYNYGLRIHSSR